ncbi:hypothetical protein OKW45_006495 [Paraburkholderia sp. WSM4175]|uniref:hypothetical protein n=1 Tax=Paraburkholderia sp. WSM4175 TaxID=2991072 RepID=UPI003D1B36E3
MAIAEKKCLLSGEHFSVDGTLIQARAGHKSFVPKDSVFLETGSSSAGLQHIIEEHGAEFANMGVSPAQIPEVVMQAVTEGNIVGYQGSGTGRHIYQVTVNGQQQRIAVTVGSNGFIVGANPRGSVK